eukprot:gene7026-biopygen7399
MSGAFEKKWNGEIVGQIVFLLAFDKVCKDLNKDFGEVVPLRLVLTELLPVDLVGAALDEVLDNCTPDSLRSVSVACVQFVNMCGQLQRDEIMQLAERHA